MNNIFSSVSKIYKYPFFTEIHDIHDITCVFKLTQNDIIVQKEKLGIAGSIYANIIWSSSTDYIHHLDASRQNTLIAELTLKNRLEKHSIPYKTFAAPV